MPEVPMEIRIRRIQHNKNLFEFIITTPSLRTQFRLPREQVNELRILIEKALTAK
ncbi:MAG: hypothetical protein GF333_08195 [Candidatus Omnitrophica bacterium]|nr:hypothetical protein [Candidatus Omnitrophota bacterium]